MARATTLCMCRTRAVRLDENTIEFFGRRARLFAIELKTYFPAHRISPKVHFLSNHMVEFLREHKSIGRFSEQGLEAVHQMKKINGFTSNENSSRSAAAQLS
eukprot:gnl/Spiro4/25301_TR12597_c0_g1_i1.p3 gnl/Spiro4/25301_TR12597_c0_g1~~gnl/Spiro4/25301_TR12597_c0_g1_i1.p3  ORF type:complete len:102 (+),score=12.32 gnl/Spiro4/25301_TR12597_c0_g1_i1:284-589(+)